MAVNRQLVLIKIYAGIPNILETVRQQLTLEASNKGFKQIMFFLFLNLPYSNKWNMFNNNTYTYFRTGNKYFSFLSKWNMFNNNTYTYFITGNKYF